MDSFKIKSKELKTKAKLMMEDHVIIRMGKDESLLKLKIR